MQECLKSSIIYQNSHGIKAYICCFYIISFNTNHNCSNQRVIVPLSLQLREAEFILPSSHSWAQSQACLQNVFSFYMTTLWLIICFTSLDQEVFHKAFVKTQPCCLKSVTFRFKISGYYVQLRVFQDRRMMELFTFLTYLSPPFFKSVHSRLNNYVNNITIVQTLTGILSWCCLNSLYTFPSIFSMGANLCVLSTKFDCLISKKVINCYWYFIKAPGIRTVVLTLPLLTGEVPSVQWISTMVTRRYFP